MDAEFHRHLRRLGPDHALPPMSLAQARSYCARLARSHYENFTVASLLLPRRLLKHFHAVYAYCRWADDLADETERGNAPRLLAWWRRQLADCYRGRADHPVFIALRDTIDTFRIPPDPFSRLLDAFDLDQRRQRHDTFNDLLDYCRCSANPVGHLVLYLCESFNPENARLADHVCTGLQLANFWQDVARDFTIGRVYLPTEDRRRFGYGDADLTARRETPEFIQLMRFEVERARAFFFQGMSLVDRLPDSVRIDIDLFIHGGLAILDKVEAIGFRVWSIRPRLTKLDKARLLARSMTRHYRQVLPAWS